MPDQIFVKGLIPHAPAPIAAGNGGSIDSGFFPKPQIIPHRNNHGICHAPQKIADTNPEKILLRRVLPAKVTNHIKACAGILSAYPLHQRLIVMCSGVRHAVSLEIVGEIGIIRISVKGKGEHLHRGNAAVLHQPSNRIGQQAQVLCDDRKLRMVIRHMCLQLPEKGKPRPPLPDALRCGFRISGNRIVVRKCPEVIDSNQIIERKRRLHPRNPPRVSSLPVYVPAVQRVSPQLSIRRKVIRGATGHRSWSRLLVKLKELRMGPGIRGIRRHINRHVADDPDSLPVGILLQPAPLL